MVQAASSWDELKKILLEGTASPVVPRYKALFSVRQSAPSPHEAVAILSSALPLQEDSVLLRHEVPCSGSSHRLFPQSFP
ncbi:Deoxyhypusine hydroxylase [Durusdinium trenchii]|uniref:Deoxyhypusine hydroxylase n=1 Tax=Durusdinium trenchii TaxID=1381693 RepID=A0ABP0JQB1_9DINO